MAESKSIRKTYRRLVNVVPPAVASLQANVCRTPGCRNFGIQPAVLLGKKVARKEPGYYSLVGQVGSTMIRCPLCRRQFTLVSNRALFFEVRRLLDNNGVLNQGACPDPDCENVWRPANQYPEEYYAHGETSCGRPRKRCRKCGATFTIEGDHRTWSRLEVNKAIVLDLVNRASLNAILRKTGIGGKRLYERIDFIHRQMLSFERARLRSLRESAKFRKRRFALCTDAQDQVVNWIKSEYREHVQLSCLSTADNLTGFVFRSDANIDPTVGDCGRHFEKLEADRDFDTIEGLGLSARYEVELFLRGAFWSLAFEQKGRLKRKRRKRNGKEDAVLPAEDSDEVADAEEAIQRILPSEVRVAEIEQAKRTILRMIEDLPKTPGGHPPHGVVIKPSYTALAHFLALTAMLPADAILHLVTDPSATIVSSMLNGMRDRIKNNLADVTLVMFDKELTQPKKQARVAKFKKDLLEFAKGTGPEVSTARALRRAFLKEFSVQMKKGLVGIPATWWTIPIETMYEPGKRVGIVHQRSLSTPEKDEEHFITLLDRSSLHAVDSFFNFMRQRVSYLHRAGLSRSSKSFYNAFQPYRGDMLQKIVDIARVYYNWVEPRPFRIERNFENIEERPLKSKKEMVAVATRQQRRAEMRETPSTPAMRLGLARGPVSLTTILYSDWQSRCFANQKTKKLRNPRVSKKQGPPEVVQAAP
jgi:transposase-like protein